MPELHNARPLRAQGQPDESALSDAELGERIRSGAPRAHPAIQELERRHLPAVLAYARLCGRNQTAGNQLAGQALRLASEEAGRGIEPRGLWRHHLLVLVRRVGTDWARDGRRDRLSADFAAWIDETDDTGTGAVPAVGTSAAAVPGRSAAGAAPEVSAAVLTAFCRLPAPARGALWYAVVDQEPDSTTAGYLGVRADLVPDLRLRAPESMRQAFLQAYLERGDKRCLGYRRIIEAAARTVDRRRSEDLTLHLTECPRCTRVVAELTRMTDNPRMVFAEHLLGWGGAEYTARLPVSGIRGTVPGIPGIPGIPGTVPAAGTPGPVPDQGTAPGSGPAFAAGETTASAPGRPPQPLAGTAPGWGTRLRSRTVMLVAAAVVVLGSAATGTSLVASSGDSGGSRESAASAPTAQGAFPTLQAPPPVPTSPTSPGASPVARPTPSPTRTPPPAEPPEPAPTRSAVAIPAPIVPGAGYHPVVNAGTGLCLDVEDGVMANRTDVITTKCNGATTQRWRLESNGLLRNSADPGFCLDSRGDTDRGAGIWSCSSVDGRNGLNLLFDVDGAGVVSPRIDPDFALEPHAGSLGFDRLDGDADQRWNAGTSR
ncbi:RICIN domain-containing protein [Streptomyces sp. HNM0645]|uniref:RICIN domain-containing protein n=1 Tax=Streptomyces sp. HNM0645 TaxID=2782343 RepID=UPI0024B7772B|nr:RICIN domain-containing protein [Streptomyces sp. HNM0645]MDI9883769.1 RICIN domain-containing protein [Streptomyces sp. HNM0645]